MSASEVRAAPPATKWSSADTVMCRLLCVQTQPKKRVRERDVQRMFSTGIVLSALRCLLTYIVLPLLGPVLGVSGGVGPAIGLPLAVVALVFDVLGIRRFFVAHHKNRWQAAAVYLGVMGLVVALMVIDVIDLVH
ncbi:MAG: hypothetical protein M0004_02500 [Actinomycetota bacterium]|nr:hypothetical protein [Actinomycetota bacterium]